jgi:hypothetical protein
MPKESNPQLQKKGMTKEEMIARLKYRAEEERKLKLEEKKQAAKAIQDAMALGQVPGKNLGEATGPVKERIVEPGRTPRGGSDERHKKKSKLKLEFLPDPDESAFLNSDIFSRTGSSLTNQQLQDKLGATETMRLLYLLNPGKEKKAIDKEEAARRIQENAFVIGPSLIEMRTATASEVLREINLKNILAKKFVIGSDGVEELCNLIQQKTKFPGWPTVSRCSKEISILGSGRETILTPQYVMEKLGAILVSTSAKIKNDVSKYEEMTQQTKILMEKKKKIEEEAIEISRITGQIAKQTKAGDSTRSNA